MARSRGPRKPKVVTTYEKAEELRDIAEELIARHGLSLRNAKIEYYERTRERDGVAEPPRQQDAKKPGKASARNPRDQKMLHSDFVIEVNGNWWDKATAIQREALVYHLLCRCWFTEGKPKIVPVDFSGFVSEVRLYGPWSKDLAEFDAAMKQKTLPLEPEKADGPAAPVAETAPVAKAPAPAASVTLSLVGEPDRTVTISAPDDNEDPFQDTGE